MDLAHLGGQWAWDVVDVSQDASVLDGTGRWAVVVPYEGAPTFIRFARWSAELPHPEWIGSWAGPACRDWTSSMARADYVQAVAATRSAIARGDVYQANLCRVLRAPSSPEHDIAALYALLQVGNPAPHASLVRVPTLELEIASASPELFLHRVDSHVLTSPIKGTGRLASDLLAKDEAENVMIVDLMRNDLSRVCRPGSVRVPQLLRQEAHPGLVHLVSDVEGELVHGVSWADILGACFPPGSVTGAPKSSALRLIDDLEPASREIYCGAIGWVDADRREASLAVAIRTFWRSDGVLSFGTGAGITWGSDPEREWDETELKASRLIDVAAGVWQGGAP